MHTGSGSGTAKDAARELNASRVGAPVPATQVPVSGTSARKRRSFGSRIVTGLVTAAGTFSLGATVFSQAAGWWSNWRAVIIRLVMGLVFAAVGLIVGMFLSRRIASGCFMACLLVGIMVTVGGLQGRRAADKFLASNEIDPIQHRPIAQGQNSGPVSSRQAIPPRQKLVSVQLAGLQVPTEILIPSEFSRATSATDIEVRDQQLSRLNSNPGRRTRYSDWLVPDWSTTDMPWLLVASIGGLIPRQGTISTKEWQEFKAEALKGQSSAMEKAAAAVEQRLRDGSSSDYEVVKRQITDFFVSDPNSITVIMDSVTETDAGPVDVWAAAKMVYTSASIVTVYIYVQKDAPDALALLQGLVQRISAP